MSIDFVALDFETANRYKSSACSIGLVKVKNGEIVDSFYSLINPEEAFNEFNIYIHGITPNMVKQSPKYPQVLEDVLSFVGRLPVVAHNAPFDMGVIKAANTKYNIQTCQLDYFDSCSLARYYMTSVNYKLNTLSDMIGFKFNHHNALDDAGASASLILHMCEMHAHQSIPSLLASANYQKYGMVDGTTVASFSKVKQKTAQKRMS